MSREDAGHLPARLRQWGLRPQRHRGQHFLVSQAVLEAIVAAAELHPDDWVVEVGPGPGNLTRLLAEATGRVVAVEVDPRFVEVLREELKDYGNVVPVLADARRLTPSEMLQAGGDPTGRHPYKVVANLPYYLTSPILRHFLEAEARPTMMVVTVQWEVAQRLVARPPQMHLLSVAVQFYGEPEIVRKVPAGAFYPRPKVDSAVVRIRVRPQEAWPHPRPADFFHVVSGGFQQRRKQLRNTLARALGMPPAQVARALRTAGVEPNRRAESLSLEEWARVTDALSAGHDEGNRQSVGVG
ncbi:MAG: ribosomal RNA small subunit methyltransferase A [Anaerolineae bacterium]|nr:ribosomal RNA small subunit methyltransferase A [Anaerolineae bacterium]